ncbi:uncharacterized protein BDW47DRAFT_121836 [Aspergillus candidus]|uniref:Apple domain-containing protein n=1 Tax=Aspergillus candidus TaxID=41067 RepID=A0A2I2FQ31_ASPCN|nr:hypothetical protein BDW47DRAFT_121836 [Aspergillus candidus]PLB42734.1 hypothetical protein BDW47DRAFT_121836 [Aspergillus candidus]
MKFTTAVSALVLRGSVQAQRWLQNAPTSCLQSEQTCPDQSGVFRAAGDELWRVWCDQKSERGSEISVVSATSNHDCLDKCDQVKVCSSGDYEIATGRCRLVEGGVKVIGPFYDGFRVPAPGFIAFNHVGRLDNR